MDFEIVWDGTHTPANPYADLFRKPSAAEQRQSVDTEATYGRPARDAQRRADRAEQRMRAVLEETWQATTVLAQRAGLPRDVVRQALWRLWKHAAVAKEIRPYAGVPECWYRVRD